jgi:hypothetical protein
MAPSSVTMMNFPYPIFESPAGKEM